MMMMMMMMMMTLVYRLQIGPEDRKLRWGDREKGLAPEFFSQNSAAINLCCDPGAPLSEIWGHVPSPAQWRRAADAYDPDSISEALWFHLAIYYVWRRIEVKY